MQNMLQLQKKIKKSKLFSRGSAILLSATLPFCLQGCMGVYEGGFECPAGEGVGCKSISEVNQMVNEGDLPPKAVSNPPQASCKQCGSNLDPQQSNVDPLEASRIWYSPWALGEV
ncbi:MAG: hypothetical protein K2P93_06875 [Alphaproteobacteria bacterium]|nr:hypothetical protein [Alphaproteobacteria bacterium]